MNSPFTREQQMFANSVKRVGDELRDLNDNLGKPKVIDWEQRRYEIAKDMFTSTYFGGNNGTPTGWMKNGEADEEQMAAYAVRYADALIAELKKNPEL